MTVQRLDHLHNAKTTVSTRERWHALCCQTPLPCVMSSTFSFSLAVSHGLIKETPPMQLPVSSSINSPLHCGYNWNRGNFLQEVTHHEDSVARQSLTLFSIIIQTLSVQGLISTKKHITTVSWLATLPSFITSPLINNAVIGFLESSTRALPPACTRLQFLSPPHGHAHSHRRMPSGSQPARQKYLRMKWMWLIALRGKKKRKREAGREGVLVSPQRSAADHASTQWPSVISWP